MSNKKLVNRLIKLTRILVKTIKKARIPLFSCRKSKHKYKQYQHIAVLGLMKYKKKDYRGIIELIELMPEIQQLIGLDQLPHFTTLHKFFQRFSHMRFDRLLSQTVNLFETGNCILAIDSTGYSSNYASPYYTKIMGMERAIRTHIKNSITVDTGNQIVVSGKARKSQRNDIIDFDELVTKASKSVDMKYLVADKGYDSEASHVLVSGLGAKAIIPVRNIERRRIIGRHRRRCAEEFDEQTYHRRSLNETVFSVVKKIMGSWLQSRSLVLQTKEVCLRYVMYNLYRYVRCYVLWMISTQPKKRNLYKPARTIINIAIERY